ncbi:MAG: VTT domain-containing protein [Acidobacteriota bacterium]
MTRRPTRRTPHRRGRLLAALIMAAGAAACAAPASRPARGPVSDAVKAALSGGQDTFEHDDWDRLLAAGSHDGLVDYRYFQAHRGELDAYLDRVARAGLSTLRPGQLEALLINAYNALTIRSILDHPAVSSIKEISGVWSAATHRVGGFDLTLDALEHNVLRPFFRDPRIHFAVNCASRSCAPLPGWAFDGKLIDEQLDARTRAFLMDPSHVRLQDGVLWLSPYFDWYGGDFTADGWSPRARTTALFIASYTGGAIETFVEKHDGDPPLAFLDYDWSLNASVPPDPADPVAAGAPPATGFVAKLRDVITSWGPAGRIVYVAAYALMTVLFVPASPLTVGAGVAYGVVWGTVLVSIGSVTGAGLAFLVARYLLRSRVARWVEGNQRFAAIDRAVGGAGWKIVGLTRLSPVFPFNLLNYAFGLTAVGFWPYLLTSWVAMLPGTILYVYIGAAGANLTDEAVTGTADWTRTVPQVVGLLATLVVTILITRIARRALHEAAGDIEAAPDAPGPA